MDVLNVKGQVRDVDVEEEKTTSYNDIEQQMKFLTSKVSNLDPNMNSMLTTVSSGSKIRMYDSEYLHLSFTYIGSEGNPRHQCIICLQVLSNEGMKSTNMYSHLDAKHLNVKLSQ